MIAPMTFLLEAGHVREDDDLVAFIQGLSAQQVAAIADWLALSTNGKVKLRHMAPPFGVFDIEKAPIDVKVAKLASDANP